MGWGQTWLSNFHFTGGSLKYYTSIPFVSLGFSVLIRRVFLWWQDCIGIYPWFLLVLLWFCVWISDSIGISFDVQYERGWGFYLLLFTLLESRPAVLKPFTPVPFSLLIWDATVTLYWFTTFSAQRWSNNCHYFPTSTCYFSICTLESNCLAIFSSVLLEKSREIAPEKNEETEIQDVNTCVWNLERWKRWHYMQDSERARIKEQASGLCGRRWGWGNLRERRWNTHISTGERDRQCKFSAWSGTLKAGALGHPRGVGWGGRWEGDSGCGTHARPWATHVDVRRKPPDIVT